jgi:ATP-dependent Clp protease ATP-binding subunit ClpA
MPKINVYLPDDLAESVREAQLPVSAICQAALERAVRDVTSARSSDQAPLADDPAVGLFSRFTPRARESVERAEQEARSLGHDVVGTEHVLLGIIDEGNNLALKVLVALDVDPTDLRAELVASLDAATAPPGDHIPFTVLAKHALEVTAKEALALGHNYIGCEHLLLGLLATEEGIAAKVMRRMGIELRTTRRTIVAALAGAVHQRSAPPEPVAAAALEQILQRLDAIERRLPA